MVCTLAAPEWLAWPRPHSAWLSCRPVLAHMVEIEEEENLSELSVTQLKKRMKERDIDASGCTEVMSSTCQHTGACLTAPTPHPPTP